jgi:Tfp pilus assembly protein PilF
LALSHLGQRKAAEAALRRAIQLVPDYAAAHNNLAVVYLTQDPPAPGLARWHYQKAIDAGQPRNLDLEKLLAEKGAPMP